MQSLAEGLAQHICILYVVDFHALLFVHAAEGLEHNASKHRSKQCLDNGMMSIPD